MRNNNQIYGIFSDANILTKQDGYIPITEVTKKHLLWDGTNWVHHKGVEFYDWNDYVFNYCGLLCQFEQPVAVTCKPFCFVPMWLTNKHIDNHRCPFESLYIGIESPNFTNCYLLPKQAKLQYVEYSDGTYKYKESNLDYPNTDGFQLLNEFLDKIYQQTGKTFLFAIQTCEYNKSQYYFFEFLKEVLKNLDLFYHREGYHNDVYYSIAKILYSEKEHYALKLKDIEFKDRDELMKAISAYIDGYRYYSRNKIKYSDKLYFIKGVGYLNQYIANGFLVKGPND